MALDALGREVKVSLDELKAALLADVAQEKEAAQQTDENTEALKRLNRNLEKIVGETLDREITALHKLIKKVAKQWEDANSRRSSAREAREIGKAVADAVNGRGVDKTMTLGKALERSQKRFATAFGQIGKQFQKDFGHIGRAIQDRINRLNPFKKMEKQSEASTNKFFNSLREGWQKTTNLFQGLTEKISVWEKAAIDKMASLWDKAITGVKKSLNAVTSAIGNVITKTINSMAGTWGKYITPLLAPVKKFSNWIGSYLAPIGKAIFGTVKDLFRIGKKKGGGAAQNDINNMTGGPTRREMKGEGDPVDGGGRVPKVAGGQSDLCRCICRCISKLLGVSKEEVKIGKAALAHDKKSAMDADLDREEHISITRDGTGGGGPREALIKAYEKQQQYQRRQQQGQVGDYLGQMARQRALQTTSAAQQIVFGDKQVEVFLGGLAQSISRTTGKVVEAPFSLIGELLEKSTVPGLTSLGAGLKLAGGALGGFAEGILTFVLNPLIEQAGVLDEATKAMYITTGATAAAPGIHVLMEKNLVILQKESKKTNST